MIIKGNHSCSHTSYLKVQTKVQRDVPYVTLIIKHTRYVCVKLNLKCNSLTTALFEFSLNVNFKCLNRDVFIIVRLVTTHSHLYVIRGEFWKLSVEPWRSAVHIGLTVFPIP